MSIAENLDKIKADITSDVELVAVSKTHPVDAVSEAYEAGQRHFGENKVQEMCDKQPQLPADIKWHLIGHLQTNKVKYVAPFVHLIHGVDSFKLLKEINKRAKQNERVIDCLLQIHIAEEDSKFGLSEGEAQDILQADQLLELENISIKGFMGMATFTDDSAQVSREFGGLKSLYDRLSTDINNHRWQPSILSMGMSGDFSIAINQGSNMVRVGSAIFGQRDYTNI